MIFAYFRHDPGLRVDTLWDSLKIGINKSGTKIVLEFLDGAVQGWTGKADSILHMRILLFITSGSPLLKMLQVRDKTDCISHNIWYI
jgi:hypothetical protein